MEVIKKHIFWIVLCAVLVIGTVAAGLIIANFNNQIGKYQEEVNKIVEAEKSFITSSYALSEENKRQASQNAETTNNQFRQLIKDLTEKYPPPHINSDMSALKFKVHLRQECIKLENVLRSEEVSLPSSLQYFSYDRYMQPDVLPDSAEITLILKQYDIIQEIVYLISHSGINELQELIRMNDLSLINRDLYSFMPFRLKLTGNLKSVTRFINSLLDAKYFFAVRSMDLNINESQLNPNPTLVGTRKIQNLPKHQRLAYSTEAQLTVNIILDYFEFHKQE